MDTVEPTTDEASTSSSSTDATTATGEPEIDVSIEGTAVDAGGTFAFPSAVDVAMQDSITVTVSNSGTGTLQVTGVLAQGPGAAHFPIDQQDLAAVLGPNESSTFEVAFAPTNGGAKEVTISIGNDDADENPYEIVLTAHTTGNRFRQIMPATSPPPRFGADMVDLQDGRLLLFGGRSPQGTALSDTWIFDVEAETWTQLSPGTSPPPRFAAEMAYLGNDTVLLFGGTASMGGGALGDTWLFDVVAEDWVQDNSPAPPPRFQHGLVAIGDGLALLFGGASSAGSQLGDTWIFDGDTTLWSNTGAVAPTVGMSFALAWGGGDTVTRYGGFVSADPIDETWNYSIAANDWVLAAPPTSPGRRAVLLGEYLADGRMVVWSGKLDDCCVDPVGGTFAYDPVDDAWSSLAPPIEPTPRFTYAMAPVAGANKVIIFGGVTQNAGPSSAVDETWEYVAPLP